MKKYTAILAALLLGVVSCNPLDILNTRPEATLDKETFFKQEDNLRIYSDAFYGIYNSYDEFYQEQTDHFVNKNLSTLMQGTDARQVPASGGGWSFTMLRRINTLLEYVDYCPSEEARTKYVAIARFFRANYYFEMVKKFGDVPWLDHIVDNDDPILYEKTRDSREEVIHHILEDIDFAIENLSDQKSVYRVNKWSALALKANICLYEGTFRKYHPGNISQAPATPWSAKYETSEQLLTLAAEAAEAIMLSGQFRLKDDYLQLFAEPDADTDEFILAMRFEQAMDRRNNTTAFALVPTQGMPGLTKKFVDSFLMKDGSRFTDIEGWETMEFVDEVKDRDPRLACITRTPGYTRINSTDVLAPDYGSSCTGFQLVKFVMDPANSNQDRVSMSFNDLPIYRIGEIYLIYAEAKAELGTLTQDDLDISVNLLRQRVDMPFMDMAIANADPDPYLLSAEYGYTSEVLAASENKGVIVEIRRERAIELAQEGRRWTDLMRWREGKCVEQAIYGPYFKGAGSYDLNGDGAVDFILYEDKKPADKVQVYKIGGDSPEIILTEGTSGYVNFHEKIKHIFNEDRDYLYPIPSEERVLNRNLPQNPGWVDGLDY
ncbi:MAG: RagB/SusD family nutrient uptake outer membrane protein [Candidatus Cryptobacteroides sp.]